MYAKILEGAKIKTADQEVTAPLIPLIGEAKTVTSSEFPAYQGTNMECIWGESPPKPPLRPEWGGVGVSSDWCISNYAKFLKNLL